MLNEFSCPTTLTGSEKITKQDWSCSSNLTFGNLRGGLASKTQSPSTSLILPSVVHSVQTLTFWEHLLQLLSTHPRTVLSAVLTPNLLGMPARSTHLASYKYGLVDRGSHFVHLV